MASEESSSYTSSSESGGHGFGPLGRALGLVEPNLTLPSPLNGLEPGTLSYGPFIVVSNNPEGNLEVSKPHYMDDIQKGGLERDICYDGMGMKLWIECCPGQEMEVSSSIRQKTLWGCLCKSRKGESDCLGKV